MENQSKRATWELHNMKRALEMCPLMNTEEENKRLKEVNEELKTRKSNQRNFMIAPRLRRRMR